MAAYFQKGKYRAKIIRQALGESSNGNVELQLTIEPKAEITQGGEEIAISTPYPRTIYLSLTEKTIGTPDNPGWVAKALSELGFRGTAFAQLDPEHKDHHSFVGLEPNVICSHTSWQGRESEKWSLLTSSSGQPRAVKAPEKKAVKALDAKFGKTLKALAEKPVAAAVAQAADNGMAETPAGRAESDIPF